VLILMSERKALPPPPPSEESEDKGVKGRRPKRRPEVNVPNPTALPTPPAKAAPAPAKK
jgi:hypothetical protein